MERFYYDDGKLCKACLGAIGPIHEKGPAKNEKGEMGVVRLELTETEVDGFTVHCNCRYATPP